MRLGLHTTLSVAQPQLRLWRKILAVRHRTAPARYALCAMLFATLLPLKWFQRMPQGQTVISQARILMLMCVSSNHGCSRQRCLCKIAIAGIGKRAAVPV